MFDVPIGAPGGGKSKVTSVDCDALVAYVGVTYKKCILKKRMKTQNMEMEEINERRRAWQCAALEHPCGLAGGCWWVAPV